MDKFIVQPTTLDTKLIIMFSFYCSLREICIKGIKTYMLFIFMYIVGRW